jgi:predicted nucleotide-binding protein
MPSPKSPRQQRKQSAAWRVEPSLEPASALDLLGKLKEEANDPIALYRLGETAQTSWKSRVLSVLTRSLGSDSELAEKTRDIRYGLMMFTADTPDSAWARAFASGVQEALGYIDAAIFELGLMDEARKRQAQTLSPQAAPAEADIEPDKRAVFVVHGRNLEVRDAMFEFLRAIGLVPIEWSQAVAATGRPSPYIGEVLKAAFGRAQAVLVLMTPDDEARLRDFLRGVGEPPHETELTPQARANVLFEAGMAMAWDENRTVLVEVGQCRPFSDLGGRHVLRLDASSQRRQELAQRLASTGLAVDVTGTAWHTAGDFGQAHAAADAPATT